MAYETQGCARPLFILSVAIALSIVILELVAGSMKFPPAEQLELRRHFLAVESERAAQIRDLKRGEVRIATRRGAARS